MIDTHKLLQTIKTQDAMIKTQDEQVKALKELIENLKKQIATQNLIIEMSA